MAARQQQRRKFRDKKDIFRDFSDAELIRRYRLDRAGIVAVTDLVRDELHSQTCRNKALPPELKVAITLHKKVQRKQVEFMAIAGFPGVVGVIDGTHVRIVAPKDDEYAYVNRKRYHSINVQVVFDTTYKILDIAKWPGSVHDARILDESGLKILFEDNYVHNHAISLGTVDIHSSSGS
ncbi:putative nuclease HARBI1 [Portunus trituberculatus]|uniref:putative nuclease HARBI1 n=1 Tax=Portunus trituberculatus TaxID=210409 RepID=UPI001E1CFAE3|nr:putative nuclease HARBI1 [Portunus trituberculatus]